MFWKCLDDICSTIWEKSHYFLINITIRATFVYRIGSDRGFKSLGYLFMCVCVCPKTKRKEHRRSAMGTVSPHQPSASVCAALQLVFPLINIMNLIFTLILWSCKLTVSDCYQSQREQRKTSFWTRSGYPAVTVPTHIPDKHLRACAGLSLCHEHGVYHPIAPFISTYLHLSFCFFPSLSQVG